MRLGHFSLCLLHGDRLPRIMLVSAENIVPGRLLRAGRLLALLRVCLEKETKTFPILRSPFPT